MTARRLSVAFACALGAPALARADAELTIEALGSAFVDTTRATPIGGNPGRTLGEQRLFALQRAVAIWERALDSKVPIVVQIRFQAFGCEEDGTVLAGASPGSFVRGEELSTATPELWFPGALADRLAGRDLSPGEPDLIMRVNSSLDDECRGRMGAWYYGFDGAGQENDLIEVILHELAHGLGFVSLVDPETGEFELAGEEIDAFSARIVDLDRNESWARLDAAERAASAAKPHRAAWDGDETRRATARFLRLAGNPQRPEQRMGADASGRPLLYTPARVAAGSSVSHFDTQASPDLLMEPFATARIDHALDLTLAVMHDLGWQDFCGNAELDEGEQCDDGPDNSDEAPDACRSACTRAACGDGVRDGDEDCDLGAANDDLRPDTCRTDCRRPRCGDGVLDTGERCDQGSQNSDVFPGACRTACVHPSCGDGIVDPGEACDGGEHCTDACGLAAMAPPAVSPEASGLTPWEPVDVGPGQRSERGCVVAVSSAAPKRAALRPLAMVLALALVIRRRRSGRGAFPEVT